MKNVKILNRVIAILVLAVALVLAIGHVQDPQSSQKTTKLGFEDIGELATQEADATEINVTKDEQTLFGVSVPFTQSTYIYSYDVKIKAGYDFSKITWSVDENQKKITVHLPKVKILSTEIDTDSLKVYEESESVFTPIKISQNNKALKEMKKNAQKDAIANGLYKNARSNAKKILRGYFSNGFDLDEYTIEFKEA
ncbi:MAG: DUF4230 domain-containing protein [Catenisphaera adipataccumulans]|jgi:hypothetical protein|uniref:DUF4230 domain-containing protein n=1 Tax=Catenisphaera adipataccumulans TaxID=700500 RepID=UPI003D906FAB